MEIEQITNLSRDIIKKLQDDGLQSTEIKLILESASGIVQAILNNELLAMSIAKVCMKD